MTTQVPKDTKSPEPHVQQEGKAPPKKRGRTRDKRIVLAFTSRGNDFSGGVIEYVLKQFARFKSIAVTTAVSTWMPCLEDLLYELATKGDFDYVHIMDSDVALHPDVSETLIGHEKDVIVSPVWMYDPMENDLHLNVVKDYDRTRIMHLGVGVEECFGGTFSSVVVSKRCLEAFIMAREAFTKPSPIIGDFLFDCLDGVFFAKALKLGFQPYVDWDAGPATHLKYVQLNHRFVLNLIQANERRPIFANRDQAGPASGHGSTFVNTSEPDNPESDREASPVVAGTL